jgi:hypothetical protein
LSIETSLGFCWGNQYHSVLRRYVKRVVSPTRSSEDIAGPAAFLASDLSVYVTWRIIMADCG